MARPRQLERDGENSVVTKGQEKGKGEKKEGEDKGKTREGKEGRMMMHPGIPCKCHLPKPFRAVA